MTKPSLFIILFYFAIAQYGCRPNAASQPGINTAQNLFASNNSDTSLFTSRADNNVTAQLTADSAYKNSELVAVCTPLSVDSTVHGREKAPFFLVAAKIDTVLKGTAPKNGGVYFITQKPPAFVLETGGWLLYLCKKKTAKLLTYNSNITWQWVENAPYIRYTAPVIQQETAPVLAAHKTKRAKKHRKRHRHG